MRGLPRIADGSQARLDAIMSTCASGRDSRSVTPPLLAAGAFTVRDAGSLVEAAQPQHSLSDRLCLLLCDAAQFLNLQAELCCIQIVVLDSAPRNIRSKGHVSD